MEPSDLIDLATAIVAIWAIVVSKQADAHAREVDERVVRQGKRTDRARAIRAQALYDQLARTIASTDQGGPLMGPAKIERAGAIRRAVASVPVRVPREKDDDEDTRHALLTLADIDGATLGASEWEVSVSVPEEMVFFPPPLPTEDVIRKRSLTLVMEELDRRRIPPDARKLAAHEEPKEGSDNPTREQYFTASERGDLRPSELDAMRKARDENRRRYLEVIARAPNHDDA